MSFVYVGPIGDHGWSYQHHQGLLAIKKAFGDKVETSFVENVPEGPDAERVIDQLAATGSNLIFTTSFGFMNPTVKFKVVWVSTWFDPGKESAAAKALVDQGADILMQHTDSPAPVKYAEEKGIYAFGQASDMAQFGPNAQLTAIVDNWNPYYLKRVKEVLDGTWKTGDVWDGMKEGTVVLSPWSKKIPPDVAALAEKARNGIVAGTLHPFTGPIKKQDGSPWLKAGEKATDKDLSSKNFYVEGMEGALPK